MESLASYSSRRRVSQAEGRTTAMCCGCCCHGNNDPDCSPYFPADVDLLSDLEHCLLYVISSVLISISLVAFFICELTQPTVGVAAAFFSTGVVLLWRSTRHVQLWGRLTRQERQRQARTSSVSQDTTDIMIRELKKRALTL